VLTSNEVQAILKARNWQASYPLFTTINAIISGALAFRSKAVKEIATPVEAMFSVAASDVLDYELMELIFRTGFSRVPVWDDARANIVGVLLAKDLVLITPEQRHPVISVVHFFGRDRVNVVDDEELLDAVLRLFTRTRQPFAIVRTVDRGWGDEEPAYRVAGLITMEDIIAEIIGVEVADEFNAARAETPAAAGAGAGVPPPPPAAAPPARLRSPSSNRAALAHAPSNELTENGLTFAEVRAMAAFLTTHVKACVVARVALADAERLVRASTVVEVGGDDHVYVRGRATDAAAVVIRGCLELRGANAAAPPALAPPWAVLCEPALVAPHVPDFSARAAPGAARAAVLRISHTDFARCVPPVDAAALGAAVRARRESKAAVAAAARGGGGGGGGGGGRTTPQRAAASALQSRCTDPVPDAYFSRRGDAAASAPRAAAPPPPPQVIAVAAPAAAAAAAGRVERAHFGAGRFSQLTDDADAGPDCPGAHGKCGATCVSSEP